MKAMIDPAGDRLDLLDQQQCNEVSQQVHELREHWVSRSPSAPFFTLGAASYLDANPGNDKHYRELALRHNDTLWSHFEALYCQLQQALSNHLEEPVLYDKGLGLPGFHVFLADPVWGRSVASIHADRQYRNIDWSEHLQGQDLDDKRQLSITLSIDLPAAGAGLRLWEVNSLDVPGMSAEQRRVALDKHRKPHFLAYRKGSAVVHSGHQFHQIAPMPDMRNGEQRLTMQAHALPTGRGWILYW